MLKWVWSPNPINQSLMFTVGVILAFLIMRWGTKEQKTDQNDWTRTQSYYWLVVPIGFLVATSSVYTKSNLYNHWLFGASWLMPLLIYSVDFIFGITLGFLIIMLGAQGWSHLKSFKENFLKYLINRKLKNDHKAESAKNGSQADQGKADNVMPVLWDRFTPDSQISYLKNFLALMDNLTDRKSLAFWEKRKSEMGEGEFVFRLSLGNEELEKIKFKSIKDKGYLGIEFWKTKEEKFKIRTTDGATDDPKSFDDVTDEQAKELGPHINRWYLKLRD